MLTPKNWLDPCHIVQYWDLSVKQNLGVTGRPEQHVLQHWSIPWRKQGRWQVACAEHASTVKQIFQVWQWPIIQSYLAFQYDVHVHLWMDVILPMTSGAMWAICSIYKTWHVKNFSIALPYSTGHFLSSIISCNSVTLYCAYETKLISSCFKEFHARNLSYLGAIKSEAIHFIFFEGRYSGFLLLQLQGHS